MPTSKPNRRVAFTRNALQEAMIDLAAKKPLAAITVTDICRQADINRSTFYLHYQDISALLRATENRLLDELRANLPIYTRSSTDFAVQLTALKQNPRTLLFMRTLLGEQGDPHFIYAMQRLTYEGFQTQYDRFPQADMEVKKLVYAFAVAGTAAALISWIRDDTPNLTAEQAISTTFDLLMHGVDSLFPHA